MSLPHKFDLTNWVYLVPPREVISEDKGVLNLEKEPATRALNDGRVAASAESKREE